MRNNLYASTSMKRTLGDKTVAISAGKKSMCFLVSLRNVPVTMFTYDCTTYVMLTYIHDRFNHIFRLQHQVMALLARYVESRFAP